MANELNYYGKLNQSGLTVIARVYNAIGTQVGGDISCSEVGTLAIYTGNMPTAPLGQYGVRFFSGSLLIGQGVINWDGVGEVALSFTNEQAVELSRIYQLLMLDPAAPVTHTPTKISFSDVVINLVGDPDIKVVGTRQ